MKNETKENVVASAMRRGFTLVELLVVVAILGILATMAVINVTGKIDGTRITTCESSVDAIKNACVPYEAKHGKLPRSMDDLCAEDADGVSEVEEKNRYDPWDNEYKIEIKGKKVIVISAGPDGEFGTEDDIRSDRKRKPKSET